MIWVSLKTSGAVIIVVNNPSLSDSPVKGSIDTPTLLEDMSIVTDSKGCISDNPNISTTNSMLSVEFNIIFSGSKFILNSGLEIPKVIPNGELEIGDQFGRSSAVLIAK